MSRKKKKMTRAQAAAARWEPEVEPEPETYIDTENLGNSTIVINRDSVAKFLFPVGLLVIVAVASYVFGGTGM